VQSPSYIIFGLNWEMFCCNGECFWLESHGSTWNGPASHVWLPEGITNIPGCSILIILMYIFIIVYNKYIYNCIQVYIHI
jgi:hypothetical protein